MRVESLTIGIDSADLPIGTLDSTLLMGHSALMPSRIDLDAAAAQIESRREAWAASGLDVGYLTWRDQGASWPPVITTDRSEVKSADSVGIGVRKGAQEGSVVLFDGGWADLSWWSGEPTHDPLDEAPGWDDWLDLERFGALLDRFADMFR